MSEPSIAVPIALPAGIHIDNAAAILAAAAERDGRASMVFNDIHIKASRGSTVESILADWSAQVEAKQQAWKSSPEGIALARAAVERRADLQAKHDTLMRELPALDFSNDGAVLDWLCAMQEPSGSRGVIVRRETIVQTFASRGFAPNANCGADYRDGDRDNMFRWLVGQALDGLQGPAIHDIIHKFADDWRHRFGAA